MRCVPCPTLVLAAPADNSACPFPFPHPSGPLPLPAPHSPHETARHTDSVPPRTCSWLKACSWPAHELDRQFGLLWKRFAAPLSRNFGGFQLMYGVAAHHHVLETGHGLSPGRAGTPLSSCASPQLSRSIWQARRKPHRLIAALDPAFPNQPPDLTDFQWPSSSRVGRPGETEREVKAGAKEKWSKHNESALSGDTPLPLPLAYPGTEPLTQREIDAMMNCDPELEYCKDPVYQWTAKCTRCQGTGEVSFYRKRGKEVISKCIACTGIGYVQRMSLRADKVDDSDMSK